MLGPLFFFIMLGQAVALEDDTKEFLKYLSLAEQGDTNAQLRLGMLYQRGKGTPQDYKQAFYWYREAAEKGHDIAQRNLGLMYYQARGIPQDYQKALEWFTRSAEQGNFEAQRYLGTMYKKGDGVRRDPVVAQMWFILSASTGDQFGINNRDRMAKKLTQEQIAHAQRLADKWMARHRHQ